jgi:hypothetical protein
MERCSSHCDPHEAADKIHDDILKFTADILVLVA